MIPVCRTSRLRFSLALVACLVTLLTGCNSTPEPPAELATASVDALSATIPDIIPDEARAVVVNEAIDQMSRHFTAFRQEQVVYRAGMRALLGDYDTSEEQLLAAVDRYNAMRSEHIARVREEAATIRSHTLPEEWDALQDDIGELTQALLKLAEAP